MANGPAPTRPSPGRRAGRRSASPRPPPRPPSRSSRGAGPSSRWSSGSKSNSGGSPTSRSVTSSSSVSPSGASGSGRLGSAASSWSRLASTSASSGSSSLSLGRRPRASRATAASASSPCAPGLLDLRRRPCSARRGSPRSPVELAPALVERQQLVQRSAAPRPRQRRRAPARGRCGSLQVERGLRPGGAGPRSSSSPGRRRVGRRPCARVLGEERGDLSASAPTTMFWGMIAPEKPPFRIAKSTSAIVSLRWSKFGPCFRCAAVGASLRAGRSERVAARAALGEDLRALVGRVVAGTVDALRPAAARRSR